MSNSQRLYILSVDEQNMLYQRPIFNNTERAHFFSLPDKLVSKLAIKKFNGKNVSTHLYLIVQYGYFKARHQFFNFNYNTIKDDVSFIMQQYMPDDIWPDKLPTRKIQRRVKSDILKLYKFSDDVDKSDQLVIRKVAKLARSTNNLIEIFDATIKSLDDNKMVLSHYSRLQDCIGSALQQEDQRLIKLTKRYMTKNAKIALESLMEMDEKFYGITALKFDAKSFQTKEIKAEINKLILCKPIAKFAEKFIPRLDLSRRMILHFAELTQQYNIDRFKKIPLEMAYIYLTCYVKYRAERLVNNLVQAFIYYVDKYQDSAKKYAQRNMPLQIQHIDQHKKAIGKLIELYLDREKMDLAGDKIQKMVFDILPEESIRELTKSLAEHDNTRKQQEEKLIWGFHKNNYHALIINLRPIFLAINFESDDNLNGLFDAVNFLKKLIRGGENLSEVAIKKVPTKHIRPQKLLNNFLQIKKPGSKRKTMNHYQYEFYIYKLIRENIKKNKMYINDSTGYKSFKAEVKIDPNWDSKKDTILHDLNNPILLRPIQETLNELELILESLIKRVNERIKNGDNKQINITHHRDGSVEWTIPYQKQNPEIDNPFYDSIDLKTYLKYLISLTKNVIL